MVWRLNSLGNIAEVYSILSAEAEVEGVVPQKIRKGKGLEVKFDKFVKTENGLWADFEITNFEDKPYFYRSDMGGNLNAPFFALYQLRINGKDVNMMWCGTGLKEFELKPGESKIFRVFNLGYHWKKNKSVLVGFHFRSEGSKESQIYWSENLPIDSSTMNLLLKEKEKRERFD